MNHDLGIPWLPYASFWELLFTIFGIVTLLVQMYAFRRAWHDTNILKNLPNSRDAYLMARSTLGNVAGRMVSALAIIGLGIYVARTPTLVDPIPPSPKWYAVVLAFISFQIMFLSLREITYTFFAVLAARRQLSGEINTEIDAVIVMNVNSVIVSANKAATLLFGYPKSDLIGMKMTDLMPERYKAAHLAGVSRYTTDKNHLSTIVGRPVLVDICTKEQREQTIELIITETRGRTEIAFTGIMRPASQPQASRELAVGGVHVGEEDRAINIP
jgi:PAS domain S-box-containing protein